MRASVRLSIRLPHARRVRSCFCVSTNGCNLIAGAKVISSTSKYNTWKHDVNNSPIYVVVINYIAVSEQCRPTDSCDGGHYICNNDTGEKVCNVGFKGTDCKERDVQGEDPECPILGSCKNGGTCWNHTCCCAKEYEGQLCGYDVRDACSSGPCINLATCKEGWFGEFLCKCPEGKIRLVHTCMNVLKVRLSWCIQV